MIILCDVGISPSSQGLGTRQAVSWWFLGEMHIILPHSLSFPLEMEEEENLVASEIRMVRPKEGAVNLLYQCSEVSAQVGLNISSSCIPNLFNSLHSEHYHGEVWIYPDMSESSPVYKFKSHFCLSASGLAWTAAGMSYSQTVLLIHRYIIAAQAADKQVGLELKNSCMIKNDKYEWNFCKLHSAFHCVLPPLALN